jgi:AcrR family transcriptional regulator
VSEAIGLRERKKRERRRHIEDVAMELFRRDGFEATTIEQIAAAADIAPRTFFSYFATKDDLVLADYTDRLERIIAELGRRPDHEPAWVALSASFATVASDYTAEVDRLASRFAIMATAPSVYARSLQLQAGWEQTLSEHLVARLGASANDPAPRLLAAAAVAVMRASLQHWLTGDRAVPLPVLVQQAFARLGNGLENDAPPDGG